VNHTSSSTPLIFIPMSNTTYTPYYYVDIATLRAREPGEIRAPVHSVSKSDDTTAEIFFGWRSTLVAAM
jgi:hypothetical protein